MNLHLTLNGVLFFIWEQIAGETGELLPDQNTKPYPHKRFAEISTLGSCSQLLHYID